MFTLINKLLIRFWNLIYRKETQSRRGKLCWNRLTRLQTSSRQAHSGQALFETYSCRADWIGTGSPSGRFCWNMLTLGQVLLEQAHARAGSVGTCSRLFACTNYNPIPHTAPELLFCMYELQSNPTYSPWATFLHVRTTIRPHIPPLSYFFACTNSYPT